ncbi:unnamed protein product [Fusarium fujikuroi]|nr:unnamed protein product [Fusarium fujikuroi]
MPNKPESNINWDLYIQDVNSVYITQNKTAEETIQFLREKHNLELSHSMSPPSNLSTEVHQQVAGGPLSETPAQILCPTSPQCMMLSSPSRLSYMLLHDGSSFEWVNFDDYPMYPFDSPTALIPEGHARKSTNSPSPQHYVDNMSALTRTGASFGSPSELDPMLDVSQFPPLVNLPFFQLKYAILQNIANFIPSIVTKLQALVPELYPGELSAQVQALSDPSQRWPIFQLFEVAAYFSSNNLLRNDQEMAFINWILEHNHVESLMIFLRQRQDMLTVKAFLIRLIKAGTCMRNTEFLRHLHAIGAQFDSSAEQIMEINDPEFLTFVLHTLDPELLKGEPGGHLLRQVARTSHITVAELLIHAGAEIDLCLSDGAPTAPLWEAISVRNLEMVKCLVSAGADINRYSAMSGYTRPARTPLTVAVWRGDRRIVEYLLDHNVMIKGFVYKEPVLQYAAATFPPLYELLLKKSGSAPKVTVGQLLRAANSDAQPLSEFLSQHTEVSEQMLEEAMVMAIKDGKTRAVVNLLHQGIDPNGSNLPKAIRCPLYTAALSLRNQSIGHRYIDLLIGAGADVNVDGLLDTLIWEETFTFPLAEKLIDAGFDLTRYGPSAIENALENESRDIPIFLVTKGVSVNSYGHRVTPFQGAALRQDLDLLQYFLELGADINKPPFPVRGYTALQAAAAARSMEKVQYLLSKGAEINAAQAVTGGVTALEATVRPWDPFFEDLELEEYYEAEDGIEEVFIYLLEKGAVVDRPDGSRSPLLHDIIERNKTHLLKLALEGGANTTHHWRTSSSSWCARTPLQLAAEMGLVEALKLLLYHRADPNAPPAHLHGRTALQAAASSETACIETVRILLDGDAEINALPAPFGGITALQGAAIKGHFQIALLLIREGANVNAPPAIKDGRTAIEGAAEHGRLDMVQMLLDAGAIGDQRTGFMKAISLARQNRHFTVVELLKSQTSKLDT